MFSGVGGGAFASSMSNISFFFPKSQQGLALGLNAGIGNLGVSLSQVFCPLVMKYAAFGATVLIGGQRVYNGALWWFPYCCVFIVLAWAWLSDMPQHGNKPLATRFFYYVCMQGQAYVASGAAVGIFFATLGKDAFSSPGGKIGRIFMLVFIAAVLMHLFMWFGSPAQVKQKLVIQADIFKNKHTFIMTWLYIMSFGSFIGYSGAFPALIKYLFGYIRDPITGERVQIPDPKYKATTYAFLGPLIGSLIRPLGGWLSDKFGGALVTQVDLAVMIGATFGVGAVIQQTYNDDQDPEKHFPAFFALFMLLFATTGIANGSTFKQISMLFLNIGKPEQAGPVLGWSSAIASYGAMIIPGVIGIAITQRNVPANFYGFAGYYITCFVLNAYCYLRPGTPDRC
jgi:NNP family nitrate/nitrite transporter-like MFS transporter